MGDDSPLPFVPFARPSLDQQEEEAVLSVLRSGWLTTGEVAAAFESEFAAIVGTRHALALNSATAGLHLALEAVGVGPGSVVLTTPYTFAATAEVVRYLGADPVFVDIDRATLNIDVQKLEEALETLAASGRRVSAIIPVHVAGLPCDLEAIEHLSLKHGVPVVEDAAHAFPVRYADRYVGTHGDAGVYSFYANKTITTGEGGMVATDRDEVAARIRVMRLHGIDRDVWDRYTASGASWKYDVVAPGYKYNMTDIAAAIGRVQLRKAETFLLQAEGNRPPLSPGLQRAGFPHAPCLGGEPRLAPVHHPHQGEEASPHPGRVHRRAAEEGHRRLGALHPAAHDDLLPRPLRIEARRLPGGAGVLPGRHQPSPLGIAGR